MQAKLLYWFQGELDDSDCKQHLPHAFTVPPNCSQIHICFSFTPQRVGGVDNLLTLTLFDPSGFRGAGHRGGHTHRVHIGAFEATPGYCPGVLAPGEWVVQVDTHMVMAGQPCRYDLQVSGIEADGHKPQAASPSTDCALSAPAERGPGWYRGDLHTHTTHSDGQSSVPELIQVARDRGLDFLALTDHNTVSGLREIAYCSQPDLLVVGGLELTTFWGHALCLGAHEWIDWRVRPGEGGMARIAAEAYGRGQVLVIAHPRSIGDPDCTGCRWLYPEMMPGTARVIEVWNGPWNGDSGNEEALALWYDWLNQGVRMVATAGTDIHGGQAGGGPLGYSVVYADSLSEAGLLRALRAGHLYLSSGPRLEFAARAVDGREAMMGDHVAAGPAVFTIRWDECPPQATLRMVQDGQVADQWPCAGQGHREWTPPGGRARWCLPEVRGTDSAMLAVANPLFVWERRR